MIGQVISHYRITRSLGAGGMGDVYLADDLSLGRPVAIKFLPREHTQDPQRVQRFRQEARAASALNHPNILTIHEVGEVDGQHFIATEFVDGETLRAVLARAGRMKIDDVLATATQVASALAAAHNAGIVHRDIKPENVMLRRDGYVKVLDFGLAKLTEQHASRSADAPSEHAPLETASGIVLGTVAYMSPEQATGGLVDARSDIFSFGALLYELLTGERAFAADSPPQTVVAILTREPPALPSTIPAELAKAIQRCLRKDPGRRYQSMADLKVTFDEIRERVAPQGAHRTTRVRQLWPLAAVPLLVVLAFLSWRAWRGRSRASPPAALEIVPLMTQSGTARYPTFSPDGNYVAFTWVGPQASNTDVYVQQVGTGAPLRVTQDPGIEYNPVWSPDGRWIAFLRPRGSDGTSELRLVPPLGGAERLVTGIRVRGGTFVPPPYLAWCPDAKCLIVTDSPGEGKRDGLFVVSLETGQKRQLTEPEAPTTGDTSPTVSPDGRWLVFRRTSGGIYDGELFRLELGPDMSAAGPPQRLTDATLDAAHPVFLPNGRQILFSARGGLWSQAVAGEKPAEPERLPYVGQGGMMPVVSRPGAGGVSSLVYVRSIRDANIWRIDVAGPGKVSTSPPVRTIAGTTYDGMPDVSPDGHRIAFTSFRTGSWEIWTADTNGTNATQVTSLGTNTASGAPRWSPDGMQIAFHSTLPGQPDSYVVPSTGGKHRNITNHPAGDGFPSFSQDGQWIYFGSTRESGTAEAQLWKVPVAGGAPVRLSPVIGYVPLESPDRRWLYYVETMDRPSALWRLPLAGGKPERVLEGVVLGNYALSDRGIYFIDRPAGESGSYGIDEPQGQTRLRYYDLATSRIITVAENLGNVELPLTASRDGRTIFFSRTDVALDDLVIVPGFRMP